MRIFAYKCDAPDCGVLKGDNEPWLVMRQRPGQAMEITPWDEQAAMHPQAKHICPNGQCLEKMLAAWMAMRFA